MRRSGRGPELAALDRGGRLSLPKALVGEGEALEDAARRAAVEWIPGQWAPGARADLPAEALGVALLDVGGRALAVWFQRFELGAPAPAGSDVAPDPAWRLVWVTPAEALVALGQREERALVQRAFATPRGARAALAALWRELAPRDRRERWLAPALIATALIAPYGAIAGWFASAAWDPAWVPRFAFAGLCGGWTSAAGRLTARSPAPVSSGALGALVGALLAALAASGAVSGLAVSPAFALAVAWLAGFVERGVFPHRVAALDDPPRQQAR